MTFTPSLTMTAAELAALDPDTLADGQRITVSDDDEREYEIRGADGAHVLVELHGAHRADHEAAYDHAALSDTAVWMPLTTVVSGVPELVWDADDSLIPTKVPT